MRNAPATFIIIGTALSVVVTAGKAVARSEKLLMAHYTLHCSGCHGADGAGLPEHGIPNFTETGVFTSSAAGRAYLLRVPGVAQSRLSDEDLAALLNWLLVRYSAMTLPDPFIPFTAAEVARYRQIPDLDPVQRRDVIVFAEREPECLE